MPIKFDYKHFLKNLPARPGIYQMLDAAGHVLYVGKAKDLKKRVASYFRGSTNTRTLALINQIAAIEIILTQTENEALLLESNLIKELKPRYNVLFRDDKSYPFIFLSDHTDYPRMDFHRGPKKEKGSYYGPYPSATAVRETLSLLQKLFKVRQCSDTFFKSRTRPCIQYQIDRCTAPCVSYIDPPNYQENVALTRLFLEGRSLELITHLIKFMEKTSEAMNFEEAARYRDQIAILRRIQEKQYVATQAPIDVDVIAVVRQMGFVCVHILFIRAGRIIGNHAYFPHAPEEVSLEEVISEFLPQYYLSSGHRQDIPQQILVNHLPEDAQWIAQALSQETQHKIEIILPKRSKRLQWLKMSLTNAYNALKNYLVNKASLYTRFEALQQALKLDAMPQRVECFDISHTFGEAIVGACVVFSIEGPVKESYRRYNIEGITKGDDYAALYQTLLRRYIRVKKGEGEVPDLILIDGGKGQIHQAEKILEELQITGVTLLGIAKGPGRKSGFETIYLAGRKEPLVLAPDSPAFHLLQQIRDEAHRFAITGHKHKRDKQRRVSWLQTIPGVGPQRRKQLLQYFGGLQEIKAATIEELAKVPGINRALAQQIYESLHH